MMSKRRMTSVRLNTSPSVPTVFTAALRWFSALSRHGGQWHFCCVTATVPLVKFVILSTPTSQQPA